MKLFVFLSLFFSLFFSQAQDKSRSFSKNSDAYSITEAKYNSNRNDYCAVKFFDATVFTSSRKGKGTTQGPRAEETNVHLYTTEKTSGGKDRKPKIFLADLKTKYNDGPVCFNKEGSLVYFSRNHFKNSVKAADGKYKYHLFEGRLNINGIDTVMKFLHNSNEYNIMHPSVSSDGKMLFFASDMPGGSGGMDIYFCRKTNGVWEKPVNLGNKVNTAGNEVFPFIAPNDVLYFSSDGHAGMGGLDIYESTINNDKGKKPYNMGEPINSKYDDFGFFLSYSIGYISSNRKSEGKDDDIYELEILKPVKRGKEVTIITKDKATGAILPNTPIIIDDDIFSSDDKGEYQLMLEEEKNYKLRTQKPDYFDAVESVSSSSSPEDAFKKEMLLEKDPKPVLSALIRDAQTGLPAQGVTVKLKDMITGKTYENITTALNGKYEKLITGKKLNEKIAFTITLDKPGFLQKTVTFNMTLTKPGEINLSEKLDLAIGKVQVGTDLAKLIEIKPIYFDLGKQTIRPDAAIELDKIVAVMNEYPGMVIELGSHTDCRSAAASNLKLSTARAKASAEYIVKKGIAPSRITGKGYGETKLLNGCACEGKVVSSCSEEEHTKNRRTEFVVTKMQ